MKHKNIQSIALIYGKKELIEEFLENFHIAKKHDSATINAVLVKSEMKKELKHYIWKGD